MAAPTINVGFTQATTPGSNETTSVVTTPTNTNGDGVYIAIASDLNSGQVISYPVGWSDMFGTQNINGAGAASLGYKIASSEPGTISVTLGTAEKQTWIAFAVNGDGGINAQAMGGKGSIQTATFPAITTTVNDCLLIRVIWTDINAGTTLPMGAMSGSGWVELAEQFGASAAAVAVFYKTLTTAGVEASGTVLMAIAEQWTTATFAIAPAAAPATSRSFPNKAPIISKGLARPYLRI